MTELIDLSHPIVAGMITYPGLPGPSISDFLSRADSRARYTAGTTFHIGRIDMISNTGTYIDSPFHRFERGADVAALPLDRVAELEGTLLDAAARGRALAADVFDGAELSGRAVLVRTGWDEHWLTPRYGSGHPYLTRDAAELLVSRGAALVGIDSLNIDDTEDWSRPVHTLLLEAGIPIVEHLTNLGRVPASGFRFSAVPAPIHGLGSFPVRAFARVS